jgi:hypothetical protein
MQIRSPYAYNERPNFNGCNELIEKFKESVPIGSPMMLKSARSVSFAGSEFNQPKVFYLLEKRERFAICGMKLPSGKMIRECFPYHEILLQHGQVRK